MSTKIRQLGYLGFEVSDVSAWERFAVELLGMEVSHRQQDGSVAFRMDGHAYRLFVTPGSADDLAVVGWQVDNADDLRVVAESLRSSGIEVESGSDEIAAARRVEAVFRFRDPAGNPVEVFCGPAMAEGPYSSKAAPDGFVADELGLGHLVITTRNREEHQAFYCDQLGFTLTDYIRCDLHGYPVDLSFLHVNPRHHSLAFGGALDGKHIHHFMVQYPAVDQVGLALNRMLAAGVRIENLLGRHPNDKMLSFYARTPSGFQIEVGTDGVIVDDATWEPKVHDCISEWGHQPPPVLVPRKPKR